MPDDALPENTRPMTEQERIDAACEWADYRNSYGIARDPMVAAHKAFLAGYQAALQSPDQEPGDG